MIMQILQSLEQSLKEMGIHQIVYYLIQAAIIFLPLYFGYFIFKQLVKRIERKNDNDLTDEVRKPLQRPIFLLIIVISLWLPSYFIETQAYWSVFVNKLVTILIIIIFAWIAIALLRISKNYIVSQFDTETSDNLKARKALTQFNIIERVLVFLVVLIAIALILMSFSEIRKVGISMIASAGLTGIILGLAAQKILGGMLAGIQIAITQPIRYDDVVIVEKEWGWIEEIHLTYVVVRIWDKRRLVLPTSYFIEKPFQNWTRNSADILGTVFLHVDYRVPVEAIREEQNRILNKTDLWDGKVNVVQVTDTSEKTIEVRSLVSAANSPKAWDLRVLLREKLIAFLRENYPESLPRTRIELIPNQIQELIKND